MQYSPPQTPPHSTEDAFAISQQLETPFASEWSAGIVSPFECLTTNSPLQSPSIDTFYGHESTSFASVSVLLYPVAAETSRIRLHRILPSAIAVTSCYAKRSL